VRNPKGDGRWKVKKKNQVVYVKVSLNPREQLRAVEELRRATDP
jgi:hypothetical protein